MRTRTVQRGFQTATAYMPEASDVAGLRVGGQAPDAFGAMAEVTELNYRGVDINFRPFACYFVRQGSGSMSNSMKEGELMRTVGLTRLLTSAECDALEAEMRQEAEFEAAFAALWERLEEEAVWNCVKGAAV